PGMTPGTAGTLQNSQCSLNVGSSSVSGSGNNLTVTVAVTFKSSFAGQKNLYSIATDNNYAVYSSWKQLGVWTVASGGPMPISVTPSSGSGISQTFTLQVSDDG